MILGADGKGIQTGNLVTKKPIVDLRVVMFGKMMVHPLT